MQSPVGLDLRGEVYKSLASVLRNLYFTENELNPFKSTRYLVEL